MSKFNELAKNIDMISFYFDKCIDLLAQENNAYDRSVIYKGIKTTLEIRLNWLKTTMKLQNLNQFRK